MKSKKGLLASKIILFMGKERPEIRTDVAADASLPSSFTYQPEEEEELRHRCYAAFRGLYIPPHQFEARGCTVLQCLLVETICVRATVCYIFPVMLHAFKKQKAKHILGQNEAYLNEGFVESLRYIQVCTALCNYT